MKITIISDTHGLHDQLTDDLIGGDILIHCGDVMTTGYDEKELIDFCEWFNSIKIYKHKIFIAGNHCRLFEMFPEKALKIVNCYKDIIYLQDSFVKIQDTKIYGSPWQPEFYNWAFNLTRNSSELLSKWDAIPKDTNILITHSPPFGILDSVRNRGNFGCDLLKERTDKFKNLLHCWGHIHDSYGIRSEGKKTFINASNLNEDYEYVNKPINIRYNQTNRVSTLEVNERSSEFCRVNKELILEEYVINKLSPYKIKEKYNVNINAVRRIINANGVSRSVSESKRGYDLNLSLFEKIDCHWKAYFLGWLYSDGNIYRGSGRNTISLCITETDKYILEYFNNKVYNGDKPLNYRKSKVKKGTDYVCKPLWRFQIESSKICDDLEKLGLIERKSLTKKFPEIEKEFICSFVQGYFEGNGSIVLNRVEPNRCIKIFSGSFEFITTLQNTLEDMLNIKFSLRNEGNVYTIYACKKEYLKKFYNFIYSNSEIYLRRKKVKFNN